MVFFLQNCHTYIYSDRICLGWGTLYCCINRKLTRLTMTQPWTTIVASLKHIECVKIIHFGVISPFTNRGMCGSNTTCSILSVRVHVVCVRARTFSYKWDKVWRLWALTSKVAYLLTYFQFWMHPPLLLLDSNRPLYVLACLGLLPSTPCLFQPYFSPYLMRYVLHATFFSPVLVHVFLKASKWEHGSILSADLLFVGIRI